MSFGKIWRDKDADFWDGMWRLHGGSPMTLRMMEGAKAVSSLCEVGCGHGHFLQAILDRGWRGRFVGFEMSEQGCARVRARCDEDGVEHAVYAGDYLDRASETPGPHMQPWQCQLAMCRGVVQHQAHWMPMVCAMLRHAQYAVVGIGYVSDSGFHQGRLRGTDYYDVHVSPEMLEREAKAAGLGVKIERFQNEKRKCDEILATFWDR